MRGRDGLGKGLGGGGGRGSTKGDEGARIFSDLELEEGLKHLLRNSQQADYTFHMFTFHMCHFQHSYLISRSGIQVKIFWVPSELMPTDPVSRYLDDFGGNMGEAELRALEIFHDLQAMEHEMKYMGRVNELHSPEERQDSRAKSKEEWNRRQRMKEWKREKR